MITGQRLLVCGGRDYYDRNQVFESLDFFRVSAAAHGKTVDVVISGHARGADTLGEDWARARAVSLEIYPITSADWDRYGRRAGHIRNKAMLDQGKPTGVIAFPGGAGTADMMKQARAAGVPVWEPMKDQGQ